MCTNNLFSPLLAAVLVVASVPLHAETSMSRLVQKSELTHCRQALVQAAEQVIGKRPHRLLEAKTAPKQQVVGTPKDDSKKKDSAAATGKLFHASGVVSYRDRDVHVSFTATEVGAAACQVVTTKSFTVKEPCIAVREEVFKKWDYQGQLNPLTMVMQNRRNPAEQAFLSNQFSGRACLATTRWLH